MAITQSNNTFDEIETLVKSVDDIVAWIESHYTKSDVGQQIRIAVDLVQCVVKSFQWLDSIIALSKQKNRLQKY